MMDETYSLSMDIIQCREVSKGLDAREEEVGAAPHGGEGGQAGDFLSDRALGDFVFERAILVADYRVALIAEFMEVLVVCPDVLRELNWRMRLAQITKAAMPCSTPSSGVSSGKCGPKVAPRRIMRRRFILCAVSRGSHSPDVRAEAVSHSHADPFGYS